MTRHSSLAQGNDLARRYPPVITSFAAVANADADSLQALEALVAPGERVFLLQADAIALPPGLSPVMTASAVQMVAETRLADVSDSRVQRLTENDAADMLELASVTEPGTFTPRLLSLGCFWGVRIEGRLVAIAGERMRQPGYSELATVCTHPEFRGRGLGKLVSLTMANHVMGRGETPWLGTLATNTAALRLYDSAGFTRRATLNVAVVQRTG